MIEFFATIELASRSALIDAYNCGEQRRECGGVIYHEGRGYYYSEPVTQDHRFAVTIPALAFVAPSGSVMVADYHNHICSVRNKPFAQYFSAGDALADSHFEIVGYMLDGCTGNIKRYDPRQDEREDIEVDLVSGKKFYLTSGHVSGWVDVYE